MTKGTPTQVDRNCRMPDMAVCSVDTVVDMLDTAVPSVETLGGSWPRLPEFLKH